MLFVSGLSPGLTRRAPADFGMAIKRIPENIVGSVAGAGKALDSMYRPSVGRNHSQKAVAL
jgi:hypothetical protein